MNSSTALRTLKDLPSPSGLPLIGHALQLLDSEKLHLKFESWGQELGAFFIIKVGKRRMLAVNDAEVAKQILRDRPEGYSRISNFQPVAKELGLHGLFSAEGEHWRNQRRVWMATLNAQQLKHFHEKLMQTTHKLLTRWQKAADSGEAVDVAADLMRYTVDVTMQFALGHEANTLEKGEDVIQRHLDCIFPAVGRRLTAPFAYWRYFKLPQDRELDKALAALRVEVGQLIDNARQRLKNNPLLREAPTCFLEALLIANESEGSDISDQDVFANTMTVLLGGEDTTANTLAWLIHHCSERPDIFLRMRAEADGLMNEPDQVVPRADRFPHLLHNTDAAINETLRLRPVGPIFFLETLRDTVLNDLAVPAKTEILLLLRAAAGSSPNSIPPPQFEPMNEEVFAAESGPGRGPTLPFGYGPRMCPGRNLALAELRSVALMLARNFDLEAVPGEKPVGEKFSFTLVPEHLRIRFHRRKAM